MSDEVKIDTQRVIKDELWARLDEVMRPVGSRHELDIGATTLGDWLGDRVFAALLDAGLAALSAPSEPAAKIDGETITVEWLKHCGWQDADVATALGERDHSDCDLTPDGWDCSDGDGNRLHPLQDEVDEIAALVMFVLERLSAAPSEPVPDGPRVLGYVVATKGADGHWHDDWDGKVHNDLATGKAALAECRDFGCESTLGILTEVVEP